MPPPKRQRSIDDDDDDFAADETETEQRGEGRVRDEKLFWLEILRNPLEERLLNWQVENFTQKNGIAEAAS